MPATWFLSAFSVSSRMPSTHASHQSDGFYSDQPGCGKLSGYSLDTIFSIVPSVRISSSLTADVPKSIPMYNMPSSLYKRKYAAKNTLCGLSFVLYNKNHTVQKKPHCINFLLPCTTKYTLCKYSIVLNRFTRMDFLSYNAFPAAG